MSSYFGLLLGISFVIIVVAWPAQREKMARKKFFDFMVKQSSASNPVSLGPCASAGFDTCCEGEGVDCLVEAHSCYCDHNCHREKSCCEDIHRTCPLRPTTCRDSHLSSGCCNWATSPTCYVQFGQCYCDKYCFTSNDCCSDASNTTCEDEELLSDIRAQIMRTSQKLMDEIVIAEERDVWRKKDNIP